MPICSAFDYPGGSRTCADLFLQVCNILFLIEMILKIAALRLSGYLKDRFNIFDALLVISAWVATLVTLSRRVELGAGSLTVLRSLRVVRVLRVTRMLPSMKEQLCALGRSMGAIIPVMMVLGIHCFIFGLIGEKAFGATFPAGPRNNFETVFPSVYVTCRPNSTSIVSLVHCSLLHLTPAGMVTVRCSLCSKY